MPAARTCHDLEKDFQIGDVHVEFMEGNHPGGVTIFKLTGSRKSIVFATENTLNEDNWAELLDFAAWLQNVYRRDALFYRIRTGDEGRSTS